MNGAGNTRYDFALNLKTIQICGILSPASPINPLNSGAKIRNKVAGNLVFLCLNYLYSL